MTTTSDADLDPEQYPDDLTKRLVLRPESPFPRMAGALRSRRESLWVTPIELRKLEMDMFHRIDC